MKGYVIKNKEGKYGTKEGWLSNNLLDADIFKDYELALSDCLSDEKPVEITIIEGNLEKNQKAIECLEEVKEYTQEQLEWCWHNTDMDCGTRNSFDSIYRYIDNKIKELESEE